MDLVLHKQLETARCRITPITIEIAEAMLARESSQLAQLETGSRIKFPHPFRVPPMMDDFLPAVIQRLQYEPAQVGWWGWLFADKDTRVVLGSVGVSGPPDETGAVGIAFSIYPENENQGYTKEAVKAVTDWVVAQPGVKSLRMTIHPKNYAAVRIAQHAKFELKGTVVDAVVGEVHLYEAKTRIIVSPPSSLA
ncbi:MAG: GNAT family N-acetyltransferase [Dehalococcoidia bacterium]|nr:GNAT family N-acetyltransferase [Dehalococcoidia bacterium]